MPPPAEEHHTTRRIGRFMSAAAWVVALGLMTLFFNDWLDRQQNPNRHVAETFTGQSGGEVVLKRNRYGHYVTSGLINGREVVFMLDTGASDVSVPANIARQLGLERGAPLNYQTANGIITAYRTTVDEIRVGGIAMRDIPASINPHSESEGILLGMSFLRHIEFTQRGDTLILRQ